MKCNRQTHNWTDKQLKNLYKDEVYSLFYIFIYKATSFSKNVMSCHVMSFHIRSYAMSCHISCHVICHAIFQSSHSGLVSPIPALIQKQLFKKSSIEFKCTCTEHIYVWSQSDMSITFSLPLSSPFSLSHTVTLSHSSDYLLTHSLTH